MPWACRCNTLHSTICMPKHLTVWITVYVENSKADGNTKPPSLPLINLYAGQESTVRTGHGTTDWFQIGQGVCQGCILTPCYLTSMQSTS